MVEGACVGGRVSWSSLAVCPSVAVPALGRLEEEGHKFEAILSYRRPVLKGLNKVT